CRSTRPRANQATMRAPLKSDEYILTSGPASVIRRLPETVTEQLFRRACGAIVVPSIKQLRRLLPYYTPSRVDMIAGLTLVVVSTAITSVIPWLLRLAIADGRAGAPL